MNFLNVARVDMIYKIVYANGNHRKRIMGCKIGAQMTSFSCGGPQRNVDQAWNIHSNVFWVLNYGVASQMWATGVSIDIDTKTHDLIEPIFVTSRNLTKMQT